MNAVSNFISSLNIYPHLVWKPDPVLYDCSNRTMEEWVALGTKRPLQGWFALIFGVVAIIVYILTLAAYTKKEFLRHPCYRMMYFTSVNDIVNLVISNIVSGYLLIVGANFCTHPVTNYIFGAGAISTWSSMNVSVMALALGRLAEITERGRFMFRGRMTWFWMFLSFMSFVFVAFFTHPVAFNSTLGTWMFSPLIIDDFAKEVETFSNPCFLCGLVAVSVVVILSYVWLLMYLMMTKPRNDSARFTKMERDLFIQCTFVCMLLCGTSTVYICVLLFEVPPFIHTIAQIGYQVSECGPLLGYLVFNPAIRSNFFRIVKISPSSTSVRQ